MPPGERAVAAVDRERFIPATIYVPDAHTGWLVPLNRDDAPETWSAHVHADEPIVTAVDYDPRLPVHLRDPSTGRGLVSTSSSSKPSVMARMVDCLDLAAGVRVLEIGTGTGFNAAVLAHLAGSGTVTSVESASDLAEAARRVLAATRYDVEVVTGDGTQGHPPGVPYDRVMATAAVHTMPYAWVAQTRPGGLIVAPWAPTFHPDAPLAVLTVREDGTAQGRCVAPAPFMPMDGQRVIPADAAKTQEPWESSGRPECTRFGITITADGQRVWLDDPANLIHAGCP
ncbi:Protein-L-isoaspartate O-methyltransferase [Nocardiopsis gilva]